MHARPEKTKRVRVRYEGRVQGVGFRFTTVSIAQSHKVYGWVANLPDGSVSLVAEGTEEALQAFLRAIRSSALGRHILHEQTGWEAARGDLSGFSVNYRPGT